MADGCVQSAVVSLDEKRLCRVHFIQMAYRHLDRISLQIQAPAFHSRNAEAASICLEACMREAANIACAADFPPNLERAQLLDILLWASELHGRLRRGPRVAARIPILLRCENPERPWEEKAETQSLSQHGFSFVCRHELREDEELTCVRLDNGRRVKARVAWVRSKEAGENEAGLEFSTSEDFWGFDAGLAVPVSPGK
jgi:hypothetical protein